MSSWEYANTTLPCRGSYNVRHPPLGLVIVSIDKQNGRGRVVGAKRLHCRRNDAYKTPAGFIASWARQIHERLGMSGKDSLEEDVHKVIRFGGAARVWTHE
ncbi:hypothetical protein K438DRAFT_1748300 [Mycena galopus ATCC 62051]|nr:hypothetical protein K438DRAFT_1748300 [Mycena galopus ATCC 62051]